MADYFPGGGVLRLVEVTVDLVYHGARVLVAVDLDVFSFTDGDDRRPVRNQLQQQLDVGLSLHWEKQREREIRLN